MGHLLSDTHLKSQVLLAIVQESLLLVKYHPLTLFFTDSEASGTPDEYLEAIQMKALMSEIASNE